MDFLQRPLAITDVETTGMDAQIHEIIEIGLLVIDQRTLEIIDEYDVRVAPEHIETAAKKALKVNGYNHTDWMTAVDLNEAMAIYSKKTKDAVFVAHNVFFDWSFISEAFKRTGTEDLMDYHRADIFSIVWGLSHRLPGLEKFRLSELCKYFGVTPEPEPHRAINGVRAELEVLRAMRKLI